MPIVRIESAEFLVGMELKNALQAIADHGYESRVVWRDGRTIVPDYKPDYDPLRVNLHVAAGKITKSVIG